MTKRRKAFVVIPIVVTWLGSIFIAVASGNGKYLGEVGVIAKDDLVAIFILGCLGVALLLIAFVAALTAKPSKRLYNQGWNDAYDRVQQSGYLTHEGSVRHAK